MNHFKTIEKRDGVDVGYRGSDLEPLGGVGRVGKCGIDKNYTLEQMIVLAYEIKANIIIKGGKNAKWYLKKFDIKNIEIQKQSWRNSSRVTMWIIE